MTTKQAPVPVVRPDIELPPLTRRGDAVAERRVSVDNGAVASASRAGVTAQMGAKLPFLVERLLSAPGPFGLEVEIKSDDRVVGSWSIEVNPRGAGGEYVSQARANLHVCGSARRDPRATGAFLVLSQWRVRVTDSEQLEHLYEALSIAAIERLDSLLGAGVPGEAGDDRSCVLFLIDGRRLDRKLFSLDRLQIRVLEDLEHDHAISGFDLRVAHRRGTGTPPHLGFAPTLPAWLPANGSGTATPEEAGRATAPDGEVFVRETLSPANMRWNRRAGDRLYVPAVPCQ